MRRNINFFAILMLLIGFTAFQYGCSSSKEAITKKDSDSDGLTNKKELAIGTNPHNPDTDGDGLTDGAEVSQYNTNPTNADTDGDGLSDGDEVHSYQTNPNRPDTDSDGLSDGAEISQYHTDPLNPDTDSDGLTDGEEVNKYNTDPNNPDTDGDGITDGEEIQMGTDPLDPDSPEQLGNNDLLTIHFAFDKSSISDKAARKLTHNIHELMNNPTYDVRIDAYTDYVGSDQYNLRLSVRRANSVASFYKHNGIPASRIQKRGLGKAPQPCLNRNTKYGGCRKTGALNHTRLKIVKK